MFEDSLNSVSASNQIKVIAEPILSPNSESKNIFLYVILVYFVTIISLLSIKAIIRLKVSLRPDMKFNNINFLKISILILFPYCSYHLLMGLSLKN